MEIYIALLKTTWDISDKNYENFTGRLIILPSTVHWMSNSTSVPHSEHRYSAGFFFCVFLCWPNLYAGPNQTELWIVWCFVQQQVWVLVWVQFRGLNTKDEYSETTDGAWARHMDFKKKKDPATQRAPKKHTSSGPDRVWPLIDWLAATVQWRSGVRHIHHMLD